MKMVGPPFEGNSGGGLPFLRDISKIYPQNSPA